MPKEKEHTKITSEEAYVYMNPLTDFGFKKVFGDSKLLIGFLNDILPDAHVSEIRYAPTESSGWEERKAVFDLLCTGEDGEYFLVEMQRARQIYFSDRALFYASCLIRKQAPVGACDFALKRVCVVSLLDFTLEESMDNRDKHIFEYVSLMNERTKERFSGKLRFIYIQLTNFNRKYEELETNVDYWLYFLKNLSKQENMPPEVRGKIFERMFEIARIDKLNKEEMITYNKSVLEYNDIANAVQNAKQSSFKLGEERGIKLGEERRNREVVINSYRLGLSVSNIANITDLPVDEVNAIIKTAVS